MPCIFCGRPFAAKRRRSKEHIWPTWMHELLPEVPATQTVTRSSISAPEPSIEIREMGNKLHQKLKPSVVCEVCNNGWMSRLETSTKPVLLPMILGKRCTLSHERQKTLATWFCLKNMVAEYTDLPTRATPDEHRRIMFERCEPPPRTIVWIGQHVAEDWTIRYRHHGLQLGLPSADDDVHAPPMNTQIATLTAGGVMFHLFSRPSRFPLDPGPTGPFAAKIARIHPKVRSLKWPVGAALTNDQVNSVSDRMLAWLVAEAGIA